jgi:hypothetical protein
MFASLENGEVCAFGDIKVSVDAMESLLATNFKEKEDCVLIFVSVEHVDIWERVLVNCDRFCFLKMVWRDGSDLKWLRLLVFV